MENLPKDNGEYQYLDGGKLLYHVQSNTYYILARGYEGRLEWVVSPYNHQSETKDSFASLGVQQTGDGVAIPDQSFSTEIVPKK
jgi:hypothetical protein